MRLVAWIALTAALVTAFTVLACAAPLAALGGLLGIIVVLLAVVRPKLFFVLGMLALLMQRTLALHLGSGVIDYLDEGFVAVCAIIFPLTRAVSRRTLRPIPGMIPFALFLLVGIISSVVNFVPFGVATQGAILIAKGFILAIAAAQLDWSTDDLRRGVTIGAWASVILIIGAAINLLAPGPWSAIVLAGQTYGSRFGLAPVTSFFQHPGYFGTVMALACVAAITHLSVFGRSKTALFITVGSVAAAFLTARRKILIGLAAAIVVLGIRLRWVPLLIVAIIGVPLFGIIFGDAFRSIVTYTYQEYFVNPDAVARVRLTTDSLGLALSNFPAGAGFGRFGSAVARSTYSPLYYELGYQNVWGLGPDEENGQFLTDTFWPAIIGETGLVGTLFFTILLVMIFARFLKLSRSAEKWDRWLGLVGMAWSVQLVIESIAGAVYTAVPTFALFFALVGIAATRPLPPTATKAQRGTLASSLQPVS